MKVLHKTKCIKMMSENMSFEHIYTKYFNLDIRVCVCVCVCVWGGGGG